jgi:hypothetical protein
VDNWKEIVNESLPIAVYDSLRMAARRQIPFGNPEWIRLVERQQKGMPAEEDTVPS